MYDGELMKKAEDAIHVMAEVAGKLDICGSDCGTVVNLCQRRRGNLLDAASEYWKFKIEHERKNSNA